MSHIYEVEIKSLLGPPEVADVFKQKVTSLSGVTMSGPHTQLNHYFIAPQDPSLLEDVLIQHVPRETHNALHRILEEGTSHSIRSREVAGQVKIVIKASIGDDSSANGVSRIEYEQVVPMTLAELDKLLLATGLEYQAKWSREREKYQYQDTTITIDKNAGYGYVTEFERETQDADAVPMIEKELRLLMDTLGVAEIAQDRLERMFAYYNQNWREYYGTDNVFTIE